MAQIGLIGLGLLGTSLAQRFTAAGLKVLGFDVNAGRRGHLLSAGGEWCSSALDVAAACRRIVFSLPDSNIVLRVAKEIQPLLHEGTIVVDTTTGDPQEMDAVGRLFAERKIAYLDATIGGSSRQVVAGDVIVMVGGDREAFEACADIFSSFSRQTFLLGPCGSGARMKLVFNLVLGLHRAVLAEALVFASRCGLPPQQTLEVLKAGPAHSSVMDTKGQKMLNGDFEAVARLSQHLKDVRLILAAANRCGAKTPLSSVHKTLLEAAEAAGFGAADNSAVIKAFE
jgi:3-hydroxyisobutyrate dehydrogenase-like beta-hydroxyacid dehydrogenase